MISYLKETTIQCIVTDIYGRTKIIDVSNLIKYDDFLLLVGKKFNINPQKSYLKVITRGNLIEESTYERLMNEAVKRSHYFFTAIYNM